MVGQQLAIQTMFGVHHFPNIFSPLQPQPKHWLAVSETQIQRTKFEVAFDGVGQSHALEDRKEWMNESGLLIIFNCPVFQNTFCKQEVERACNLDIFVFAFYECNGFAEGFHHGGFVGKGIAERLIESSFEIST